MRLSVFEFDHQQRRQRGDKNAKNCSVSATCIHSPISFEMSVVGIYHYLI